MPARPAYVWELAVSGMIVWVQAKPSGTQPGASSSMFLPPHPPKEPEEAALNADLWAGCLEGSTPFPQRNEQSAGELEVRVKAFVLYSIEKRLSWAVIGISA